jgi:hypothetical protein
MSASVIQQHPVARAQLQHTFIMADTYFSAKNP